MRVITIRKRVLIFFAILALVVMTGSLIWLGVDRQVTELEVHDEISVFELEESLTESRYVSDNGKIKLLSFIFINCPDGVCPLTMQDYADIQAQLQADGLFGSDVELVTITFDPERDTTEALQEYAGHFEADPEGWRFLRGPEEDIQAVADELNFFYSTEGAGMHSTTQFIIDEEQQIRAYHRMSSTDTAMDQEKILEDLYQLVDEKNS